MKRLLCLILVTTLPLSSPAEESPMVASLPSPVADSSVSLSFYNSDIDMVLKFFTDITGKIFVRSDLVRGFITVAAPQPVTRDEALSILQAVLEVKGFALVAGPGKVVKVLTQSEAIQSGIEFSNTADGIAAGADRMTSLSVPLKFVTAPEIKAHLSPLLSKGGQLISDERMNAVIITDMASNLRRLLKMIESLDVRTPQVLIEALLMEVSLTDETKLGIEWSYKARFHADGYGFGAETDQNFSLSSFVTEGLKYSIFRDDANISALVQALATTKNVNILSTPHILTTNNQPAVIRVGEEVPVLTQTRNIQGGETIRSFDYKSVAVELEVTPRINSDREVFLKVHPLVKKILGVNTELNAPILATREAQTSVLIRDGQTVVIGGLMKDDRSQSDSKVPILGDIPLIGRLFKKSHSVSEKTELLVFITPRVILGNDEAQAVTIRKESESRSKRTPNRMEALRHDRLGRFYYSDKRYQEALAEWQKAWELAPDQRHRKKLERRMKKARKYLP